MAGAGFDLRRVGAIFLALASAGVGVFGAASLTAAQPSMLHQRSGAPSSRMQEPVVARYEVTEGAAFTFDRSGPPPLLRFESNVEVWVLRPGAGPRGDIIYRNDIGRQFLRATKVGGMTIFTYERPAGSAAAYSGGAQQIRLAQALGPVGLYQQVLQASARASRAAQHIISIEAEADPASAPLMADTAQIAAEAVVRLSAMPNGRRFVNRIGNVNIVEGVAPGVRLSGSVLTITVVPTLGYSGRPSSDRIISVVVH